MKLRRESAVKATDYKGYRGSRSHNYLAMGVSGAVAFLLVVLSAAAARADTFFSTYDIGTSLDYAIVFTGTGSKTLNMPSDSAVVGNVAIGDAGTLGLAGGKITGNVDFNGAVNESLGGGTITGTSNANVTQIGALTTTVGSDLYDLAQMSLALQADAGTAFTINGSATLCAVSGLGCSAVATYNAGDNTYVFDATLTSLGNSDTLTINAAAGAWVVINVPSTSNGLNGTIKLTGGITEDHVLFNFEGGTLQAAANGDTQMGLFMDITGNINYNSVSSTDGFSVAIARTCNTSQTPT
jgi:hypothetical protein